jgi:hypothetical protein
MGGKGGGGGQPSQPPANPYPMYGYNQPYGAGGIPMQYTLQGPQGVQEAPMPQQPSPTQPGKGGSYPVQPFNQTSAYGGKGGGSYAEGGRVGYAGGGPMDWSRGSNSPTYGPFAGGSLPMGNNPDAMGGFNPNPNMPSMTRPDQAMNQGMGNAGMLDFTPGAGLPSQAQATLPPQAMGAQAGLAPMGRPSDPNLPPQAMGGQSNMQSGMSGYEDPAARFLAMIDQQRGGYNNPFAGGISSGEYGGNAGKGGYRNPYASDYSSEPMGKGGPRNRMR